MRREFFLPSASIFYSTFIPSFSDKFIQPICSFHSLSDMFIQLTRSFPSFFTFFAAKNVPSLPSYHIFLTNNPSSVPSFSVPSEGTVTPVPVCNWYSIHFCLVKYRRYFMWMILVSVRLSVCPSVRGHDNFRTAQLFLILFSLIDIGCCQMVNLTL